MKYPLALIFIFALALPVWAEENICLTKVDCNVGVFTSDFVVDMIINPEPTSFLVFAKDSMKYVTFRFKGNHLTVEYSGGLEPDEAAQLFFDYVSKIIVEEENE